MGAQTNAIEMIRKTVQCYFEGLYHSDIGKLKLAFHSKAQVIGYFQGSLLFNSIDEFMDFVKATPAPAENGEPYDMEIVSMDITGDAAVVKVADLYLGLRFTDYLSLLKIDGEWRIINKLFGHEPDG